MAAIVAKEVRTCGKVIGNRDSVNFPNTHVWLKVTNKDKSYADEYLAVISSIRLDWHGNVLEFSTDNYHYVVE